MAEIIAVGASIIAIVQVTDRVIGLCKYWIEIWRDAPAHLRAVLIEMLTTKTILDGAQFLISCNEELSATLESLRGASGPIEGCRNAIAELEALFPSDYTQRPNGNRSKRQKVKASLTALAWPLKENKARKLLEEVMQNRATISLALTIESTHDTKDIKRKTAQIHEILLGSEREMVFRWLQIIDPSPIHHRACKIYEDRTGDWMLRSPDWAHWIDGKARCLWVHGIAGAGKTVFASHLIEETKKHCAGPTTEKCTYIYYYCYFGNNQNEAAPFLRWTINRLCREADLVSSCLYKLYRHGGEPSLVDLLCTLEAILGAFDRVYIVIDAIDESVPRDDLLKVLRDLATDSRFQKIQLLATSREYIDIEKVMQQFSISVSMSNPLVDEDIKAYVRSQLDTNPKFRHWSTDLRDEVVEALSDKAKGMFRWAACQIDVLQRLKGEATTIKNALTNLPKTLDETYERIFLAIPAEDRMFVLYVLKWIFYNNELYNENISCSILLQAIERSTYELVTYRRDYFYDEERLRELCGCLITVAPQEKLSTMHTTCTVSFAHYTVWEFLNSARILNASAAVFAITEETRIELTRTVILNVLDTQAIDLWDWEDCHEPSDVGKAVEERLNNYCMVSSIIALREWCPTISKQDDLMVLAFRLLDPSKPHFQEFVAAAYHIEYSLRLFTGYDIYVQNQFWNVNWRTTPKNTDVYILVNLLLLCRNTGISKKLLETINIQDVLQTRLDLEIKLLNLEGDGDYFTYNLDGSIIELFGHLAFDIGLYPFKLLLEAGGDVIDPSPVLFSFIGSHSHKYYCEEQCVLSRLLQLGANANFCIYMVTPLQIAVARWDFEGVKILLKAGVDPNSTGNGEGTRFSGGSICARFNDLYGLTPLQICREFKYLGHEYISREEDAHEKIDVILLQYGAKGVQGWSAGVKDE